jgi:tungstate transport system substrate-binding protein
VKRLVVMAIVVAACAGSGSPRTVVGAGTTLVDSGFIDAVVAVYEAETGASVGVIGESSQRLLDLAARGEADLVVTHEPAALAAFIAAQGAAASQEVWASRFLLVGPPGQADGLSGNDAAAIFGEIAERRLAFVSRGDGSGTYRQERLLWSAAGIDPDGEPWYEVTGQGMGLTMQVAAQRRAFVVVEEGAWLEAAGALDLVEVNLGEDLPNIYSATVATGAGPEALALYAWLVGDDGGAATRSVNENLFGRVVYRHLGRSLP